MINRDEGIIFSHKADIIYKIFSTKPATPTHDLESFSHKAIMVCLIEYFELRRRVYQYSKGEGGETGLSSYITGCK